jgi:transcription elongation factor Elf1
MGRRKTQKIIKTGPKNVTTGLCPECKTIGRIFIIGQVGKERAKCSNCNQEFDL